MLVTISLSSLRCYKIEFNLLLLWMCPLIVALSMCALQHVRSKGNDFATMAASVKTEIRGGAISHLLAL